MGDVALLATTLAAQQAQQGSACSPDTLCAAAAAQLAAWMGEVRAAVAAAGLVSDEGWAALLAAWDWQPSLRAAVLQLMAGVGAARVANGSANSAELRRAQQRVVRQVADLVRRGSLGGSTALAAA